jgi:hypothetical protein
MTSALETFGSHVERHARARARLEEKIHDRLSAQRRNFPHAPLQRALERDSGGVDLLDFFE